MSYVATYNLEYKALLVFLSAHIPWLDMQALLTL